MSDEFTAEQREYDSRWGNVVGFDCCGWCGSRDHCERACTFGEKPVTLFDRAAQARESMLKAWSAARWYADHLLGTPYTAHHQAIFRKLAWQEFRHAMYWRDSIADIETEDKP